MKCHFCESEMILDDCDYNFKGNKDNYLTIDGNIANIRNIINNIILSFYHKKGE